VNIQQVPVPRLHSASTSEDDDYVQSGPDPQTQQPPISQWTLPSRLEQCVVHTFIVGPKRKNDIEAPHINDGSMPFSISTLYFAEIVTMLVVVTTRQYHWYMDSLEVEPSPQPNLRLKCLFLATTTQMGQFYTPFHSNMMR
jgi:hypothetical protein